MRLELRPRRYGADCSVSSAPETKRSICGPGSTRSVARPSGKAAAGPRGKHTRPRGPAGRRGCRTARQAVARRERTAAEATHRARQMRRAAAQHRRRIEPAGDREVRARAAQPAAETQRRASRDDERLSRAEGALVNGDLEFRAGDRHQPFVLEHELGTDKRDFECRRIGRIAGHRVRNPMRDGVHRPRDRHPERLEPPAAPILNGRQESRLRHANGRHVRPRARAGRTRRDR